MKPLQKKIFDLLIVSVLLFVTVNSCGLPVYYSLEPSTSYSLPTNDPLNRFFSFTTSDEENSDQDIYQGTNIYYKIYNSSTNRDADISRISSSNLEYTDRGFNTLRYLNYQQLGSSNPIDTSNDTLFPLSSENRLIKIRLFTEGSSDYPYRAGFTIAGNFIEDAIPLRSTTSATFDFFESGFLPDSIDSDVTYLSTAGTDTWYVNAYAVSVGRNTSYQPFYSSLIHLGYITIEK